MTTPDNIIAGQVFQGERPLYRRKDITLHDVTIGEGESALKHCQSIEADGCRFAGLYVFWECDGIRCTNSVFEQQARASVWYSKRIRLSHCRVEAPKMFRRAESVQITDTAFAHAAEAFWDCAGIRLERVTIEEGNYLFLRSRDLYISHCRINGRYSFQQAVRSEIRNAVILSKDALWESEDCTVYDSEIESEYLGWYSKNLRLVRCRISGTQPLCYCENLILEDCTFSEDADRAFEYSSLNATIIDQMPHIQKPYTGEIIIRNA